MTTALDNGKAALMQRCRHLAGNQTIKDVASAHITPERVTACIMADAETYLRCLNSQKGQASIARFFMDCTQLGLEPGATRGLIYALPFGGEITTVIGYRGLCELARRSGEIRYLSAGVVYEDQLELFSATEEPPSLELKFSPTLKIDRSDDKLRLAYAVAVLKGGGRAQVIMDREQLLSIKKQSPSGGNKSSPWNKHFDRMCRKTALRRLLTSGEVPLALEVAQAFEVEDRDIIEATFEELPKKPTAPGRAAARQALGIPLANVALERELRERHPEADKLLNELDAEAAGDFDKYVDLLRAEVAGLESGA